MNLVDKFDFLTCYECGSHIEIWLPD